MCNIYDALSNTHVARGSIARTTEGTMTLHNEHQEVQVLLNIGKQFKLITDDGSYSGLVVPIRASRSYITVRLDSDNQDKRRYIRMGCELKAKLFICGDLVDCSVSELAYGSCMITTRERLFTDEPTTIQIKCPNSNMLTLNGMIKFERSGDNDDDLWYSGFSYMISFEECTNLENSLDELYGTLLTMLRSERERASAFAEAQ